MTKFVILLVLSSLGVSVWGYSSGAPETTCDDMIPRHPVDPQKTSIPYSVSTSKSDVYPDDFVDIKISGPQTFKGFLVQVRKDGYAKGSFQIKDTDKFSKTINCHNTRASAATHKNSVDKKDITLRWIAPREPGNYQIYVTIAKDGGTFWAGVPTQFIRVN